MTLDKLPGTKIFVQRDVRETPYSYIAGGSAVPVGSILPWLKTLVGTPSLPSGYVQCDGQVLDDPESVYDGQTIPDLNGNNQFVRGNATSGGTGGSETMAHIHAGPSHTHDVSGTTGAGSAHTHTLNGSVSSHTLTSAEMPSHTHAARCFNSNTNTSTDPSGNVLCIEKNDSVEQFSTNSANTNMDSTAIASTGSGGGHTHSDTFSNANESSHTHSFSDTSTADGTGNTGAASNDENRPPFYNVVWIIRIK